MAHVVGDVAAGHRTSSPERGREITVRNTFIDVCPLEEESDVDGDASCTSPQRRNVSAPPSPTRRGGRPGDARDGQGKQYVDSDAEEEEPGSIPNYTWADSGLVSATAPPKRRNVELPAWLQKPSEKAAVPPPPPRKSRPKGEIDAAPLRRPALGDFYAGGALPLYPYEADARDYGVSGYGPGAPHPAHGYGGAYCGLGHDHGMAPGRHYPLGYGVQGYPMGPPMDRARGGYAMRPPVYGQDLYQDFAASPPPPGVGGGGYGRRGEHAAYVGEILEDPYGEVPAYMEAPLLAPNPMAGMHTAVDAARRQAAHLGAPFGPHYAELEAAAFSRARYGRGPMSGMPDFFDPSGDRYEPYDPFDPFDGVPAAFQVPRRVARGGALAAGLGDGEGADVAVSGAPRATDTKGGRVPLSGGGPKRTDYLKKYGGPTAACATTAPEVGDDGSQVPITTMMLKNIPCRKGQEEVMGQIDQNGFEHSYDFFYLPRDVKFRANLGYAFINFLTPEFAARFKDQMNGYRFPGSGSTKACSVVPAHVQGLTNNLAAFKRTEVMRSSRKPYFSVGGNA